MLAYWDPFAEMNRLHDRFFARNAVLEREQSFQPAVDIFEDAQGIHVKVDLAGVKPEDINVQVENNMLTISGERKLENKDERDSYHRVERFFGSFSRSFALSDGVDAEHVEAKHDNGVLTVTLHKAAAPKKREIEVKAG